jgi:putative heme-binding domain-containing protein
MVYLGGAWPAEYRGRMFMGNIHGRRLNVDILKPKGSGYVASHGRDFLLANDAWARFINLRYGPDGNVYLIDWYDKQACHLQQPGVWDRSNGRVYKVCYRGTKFVRPDLRKLSDRELVELQLNANDWYVRHSRRLLQERFNSPSPPEGGEGRVRGAHEALEKIAFDNKDETRRLRGLWALHVTGGLTPARVAKGLADAGAHVRAWTVQLALEKGTPSDELVGKLAEMARSDASPVVRLYLASALQRIAPAKRWDVLRGLLAHGEDAADHNLPLMYWYAAEPLGGVQPKQALDLALAAKVPPVLTFMARRVASAATPEAVAVVVAALGKADGAQAQRAILHGLQDGLKGRRSVAMPAGWNEVAGRLARGADAEVRDRTAALSITFGDTRAFAHMRRVLTTKDAPAEARTQALASLLAAGDRELAPVLQGLVADPALRAAALRGLASYDDARTPEVILRGYGSFSTAEKRDALNTLASRPAYGKALLDAVAAKRVAVADLPADLVRQLRNLRDKALDQRIAEVWGVVRASPADRVKQMARYRGLMRGPGLPPDLTLGRSVFAKTCASCHTLFGSGGKVGPDVTGSNRANLDYLLENVLDPSAVIPKEYAATLIELKSGRVLTGIVRSETPAALTVVTANETLTVPRNEVESRRPSDVSMMPDDQLKPMSDHEVRSLFAYLQSPRQVPLLATADNARDFFNGKDLTGWVGDPKLWRVERGEIVGKTTGLAKNSFLKSEMEAADFRLTLKVKLTPNKENSGVQFRSEALPDGEMKGPQADVGAGWWGKLYEESGRGLLWDRSGEKHVRPDDWNTYVVEAVGLRVRTWINGQLCVDLEDAKLSRRGIFGLQIHSGGPMEVRFKDIRLEVLPPAGAKR